MSRVTIADLAREAEVSISTVDRLLNGRYPVKAATAEHILETAERIGFYAATAIRDRLYARRPDLTIGVVLHQSFRPFYRDLGIAIAEAAAAVSNGRVRARIVHADDLSPAAIAEDMLRVGAKAQIVSVVAAQHPQISRAIDALAARGVATIALISEHSAQVPVGYVGADWVKLGRTAGWMLDRACTVPGRLGIIAGSHRYRCHELSEIGFRSYMREHRADLHLLEPVSNFEDRDLAERTTLDLLNAEPDLRGMFMCGGAVSGAVAALRQVRAPFAVPVVAMELTDDRRRALTDGYLTLTLATPMRLMAERLVSAAMEVVRDAAAPNDPPGQTGARRSVVERIPFDLYTSENI